MLNKSRPNPELVVCGSISLDSIKTPFGKVASVIGGSAIYASLAASSFSRVGIISVAGKDFPASALDLLKSKKIDLEGLTIKEKTLRWKCLYEFDMSEAITLETELNSLLGYVPNIPDRYTESKIVLLANMDPVIQKLVAKKCNKAFLITDTMNYWIKNRKSELESMIKVSDAIVLNDGEARQFCGKINLIKCAKDLLRIGAKYVIIKKGEHGALLFSKTNHFSAPGYPLEEVRDPTGAGDSFAGALSGYLSQGDEINWKAMCKAVIFGSAVASFCTEDFSVNKLLALNNKIIEERYGEFKKIREF